MRVKLNPTPARLVEIAALVRERQVETSTRCCVELRGHLAQLRATEDAFEVRMRRVPIEEMMVQILHRDSQRATLYELLAFHADRLAFGDCPELR